MRSWPIPAALAVLLCAAAAHACFLKCCLRPPPDEHRVEMVPTAGTAFLTISSVDGYPVDMTATPNVRGDVNYAHDVDVVVHSDYTTGLDSNNIDLVLTDVGPRTGPVPAALAGAPKHHKVTRKVLLKLPVGARAAAPGPGRPEEFAMAATIVRIWELHFTLPATPPPPELVRNHKYSLQAVYPTGTTPTVTSDSVSFWTIP